MTPPTTLKVEDHLLILEQNHLEYLLTLLLLFLQALKGCGVGGELCSITD